jgi:hypothetical protein
MHAFAAYVNGSKVKQWFRFMEVHYTRPAEIFKGKVFPKEYEVNTYFVPILRYPLSPFPSFPLSPRAPTTFSASVSFSAPPK